MFDYQKWLENSEVESAGKWVLADCARLKADLTRGKEITLDSLGAWLIKQGIRKNSPSRVYLDDLINEFELAAAQEESDRVLTASEKAELGRDPYRFLQAAEAEEELED